MRSLAVFVAVGSAAGVLGCAPATVSMTVPNPARATTGYEATQSYDVPPYGEDHRYEVTLAHWTASRIGFRIHLVNADRCGQPSNYSFQLVDDRGRTYPIVDSQTIGTFERPGHLGARLNDVTIDDSFAAAVDAATQYLILQVRPIADRACTPLNFRFTFAG
jgi:hypothetical protein